MTRLSHGLLREVSHMPIRSYRMRVMAYRCGRSLSSIEHTLECIDGSSERFMYFFTAMCRSQLTTSGHLFAER
jgi:hypothetical protein